MITDFDDFPIHQTSEPISQPSQSDRNFYDRYWFNGYDQDAAFTFEIGVGFYPNRLVADGHFSVVIDGEQHCFHASRRASRERSDTAIGPLRIEVIEPLRRVRVIVAENETGIECDLEFRACASPLQEPKNTMYDDGHLIMDTTRFTQFGYWEGYFAVAGKRVELAAGATPGARDRSWGVRPVGEPQGGAPGLLNMDPGVYWVWSTVHFDDIGVHFGTFEDKQGRSTQLSAALIPKYAAVADIPRGQDPGVREAADASHEITWATGTRRPQAASIDLVDATGGSHHLEFEPLLRFQMLAIGYQHPEWGHAMWKGDLCVGSESWKLDELDPLDYKHIHLHQVCRVTMGDRVGIGVLESIVFGRHEPSGFESILDGAP